MGTPEPLPVVVKELTYQYRQRDAPALVGIDFRAARGEVILIAGGSGSGKTTLMRCLNGLIPHSYKGGTLQGQVRVFGEEPATLALSALARRVGTVLQDPEKQIVASYVGNEVAFGLENAAVPRPEMHRAVGDVLERLRIAHLRDRETFHLSGGEKQKVVVAGTLVLEPAVMLLDEPLANLDPYSLREALALIRHLADEGRTILLIEHRVEDVMRIEPDRVLYLEDGRQRYFGDLDGFRAIADPHAVKLPAPLTLRRLRELAPETALNGEAPTPPLPADPSGLPLLAFRDVNFWYEPETPVLADISFEIRPGEVVAILGPNGAGKTTLVKHAIGLLKPRAGTVEIDGRNSGERSVAQTARSVGYVFQSPSHMLFAPTVREELAFGPRNLGLDPDRIERNVAAALETVDLTEHVDDPPLALSFGQQKRVTIAAVVAMNSRVLVMDEPTAGQDYRHYTAFMDAILHPAAGSPWHDTFDAVIFITHDLDLAISYANRLLLVSDGRLAADGPPHEILDDPDLLARCRLAPTSLLSLNQSLLAQTGRFLRAEALAPFVLATDANGTSVVPGVEE